MKKQLALILAAAAILTLTFAPGVVAATQGIHISINGRSIDLTGTLQDGRVMVPLEDLAKAMNGAFEWTPGADTASVYLPNTQEPRDLTESYSIQVQKIVDGISVLSISGDITNTSGSRLTALTVYGKLQDASGKDLTKTLIYSVTPNELAPGETGKFEILFLDYGKYKDQNTRYGIFVQGFSL